MRPALAAGAEREMVVTFAFPANPTTQVTLLADSGARAPHPAFSIEVVNVDEMHAQAIARGCRIVYPLTDEPWGVRRFFVGDPDGTVINVLSHTR